MSNLSEEEAIQNLKIYIAVTEKQIKEGEIFLPEMIKTERLIMDSVKKILDLYNKEKEKNKYYEDKFKKIECEKIYENLYTEIVSKVHRDYISKDKIKEKIKELEREKQILEDNKMKDKMVYTPYQIVDAEILRLQELLEE